MAYVYLQLLLLIILDIYKFCDGQGTRGGKLRIKSLPAINDNLRPETGVCMGVVSNTGESSLKSPPLCSTMAPQNGLFKPQPWKTSPWKIYVWKPEILQSYTHPVTLGSNDGKEIFANYLLVAKAVRTGDIVGHFEYQWDSIPICCFTKSIEYHRQIEGYLEPNLLLGQEGLIVPKPNHTVLWTAPRNFEGHIVFIATFWKSSKLYWRNVTSSFVTVIKRDTHKAGKKSNKL